MNPIELRFATACLMAIPVGISAIEDLHLQAHLFSKSLFDWRYCLSFHPHFRPKAFLGIAASLFSGNAFRISCWIRLVAVALIVIAAISNSRFLIVPAIALAASYAYLFYRLPYSLDGADQMLYFTSIAFVLMSLGHLLSERYAFLGALVLTYHVGICYLTSGGAKLSSSLWRSGRALQSIMNSGEFGSTLASRILSKRLTLSAVASWCVMGGHIYSGSVLLFVGGRQVIVAIAIALTFHLSVAFLMRLNGFVFAFMATYPSLLFVATSYNRGMAIHCLLRGIVGQS